MRYSLSIVAIVGILSAIVPDASRAGALERDCAEVVMRITGKDPETDGLSKSLWVACTHAQQDWTRIGQYTHPSLQTQPSMPPDESMMELYNAASARQAFGAGVQGHVPLFLGLQPTPFGSPNSIGPYGTLGPTWQSFNGYFQPTPPSQQMNQMLYERR